ncbi:MAG: N-acetylglucosamine-6-phosphate deacetylase [Devosia sp.]
MHRDDLTAYTGARVFDGERWHDNAALVVSGDTVHSIGDVPQDAAEVSLGGGFLVPGFVDLQVNGGGGHLIGAATTAQDIALVCATHARFGATSVLPTLITDTPSTTDSVLAAGAVAARLHTSGFLGLHLEGPHLSVRRKGAHDPSLIRPMEESDLVRLERVRPLLPHLLVTIAAETVTPEQIARMVKAGIVVSIGHSDASFEVASAAFRAGASMATHLFNAMSQIGNRDPGVVGAALQHGHVHAGLIVDGHHVHPETIRISRAAKIGPGRIFLVSDSMSQAGTDMTSLILNGREIFRRDGALRLADGTLAGADLTLDMAVRVCRSIGTDLDEALRMATSYPADAIFAATTGRLSSGRKADYVHLANDLIQRGVWISGRAAATSGTPDRRRT